MSKFGHFLKSGFWLIINTDKRRLLWMLLALTLLALSALCSYSASLCYVLERMFNNWISDCEIKMDKIK
jgi:hypothetical protein